MKSDETELGNIEDWDEEYVLKLKTKGVRENTRLEFKSGKWIDHKDITYELRAYVSAMENSAGGFLVIGIEGIDDGIKIDRIKDIEGINENKKLPVKEWIRRIISDSIIPSLHPFPKIEKIHIKSLNKEIIVIQIFPAYANLHYVWYNGEEHYWFRNGSETIEMDKWLSRTLIHGRAPPPIFKLEFSASIDKYRVKDENDNKAIVITQKDMILKLTNSGLGIGKYIQIGMIYNSNIKISDITNRNILNQVMKGIQISNEETSVVYKENGHAYHDIPFKEIFSVDKCRFPLVTRINDDRVLHSGDSKYFSFNIVIERNRATFNRNIIGVFILSENSRPTYYSVEFITSNYGLEAKSDNYTEENKIEIE